MKNRNKTIYWAPSILFLKPSLLLFSSSQAPASPFPLLSTHHCCCLLALLWNTVHLAFAVQSIPAFLSFLQILLRMLQEISDWERTMHLPGNSLLVQRRQTYREVTNNNYSLQMPLAHSRLLPEVIWQILRQLCKTWVPSLVLLPGRTFLPLATSLPNFRKPEQSCETVNGTKAHYPAEGEGIIPRVKKQLGLVNPEAIRADSPEFICQRLRALPGRAPSICTTLSRAPMLHRAVGHCSNVNSK